MNAVANILKDIDISKKDNSIFPYLNIYYAVLPKYSGHQTILKTRAYIFAQLFMNLKNNIGEIEQILSAKNFASYNFSQRMENPF